MEPRGSSYRSGLGKKLSPVIGQVLPLEAGGGRLQAAAGWERNYGKVVLKI